MLYSIELLFAPRSKYIHFFVGGNSKQLSELYSQDIVLWRLHDTQYDSDLVECQVLVCTKAKQLKVQPVELVQFSYCLGIHFSESLESPAKMQCAN